ncbi:MFS transporter [Microbacterium sp. MEC084]|uniref:MFS transporter n=1 Tax=unclassified Microbacterium TaxID=2609290 RepID=UPI0006F67EAE|nr:MULTISPECIES: MFS transporter [unclassified Microbacterium]KQZ11759.1 MFS transporter [Microbacterium sp. Root53]MCD1269361.1 MFS transporter [Microbacterium sp. MEC084]
MALPEILKNRGFTFYWGGVILSEIGTRGTIAAILFHVYALTGSFVHTGLVGAAQAVAILVLSPLGGVYADRLDRKRLLQATQFVAMLVALALTIATVAGVVTIWAIYAAVLLTTAAATFDAPVRQAIIPAMVPREQLPQAFALINPSRELAVLVGPGLGGVLIAIGGPQLMYGFDALSYLAMVLALFYIKVPHLPGAPKHESIFRQIREGASYIRRRGVIWMLMSLDLSATIFSAYRVLLPAIATDVLHVGGVGYGVLAAAPSAGALLASYTIFRLVTRSRKLGRILLATTMLYGGAAILLAHAGLFWVALPACLLLGALDAVTTTIRHAAVQLETPDAVRGRVTSLYQMASRGGPAVGDAVMGKLAAMVGPAVALTLGGILTAVYAAAFLPRANAVREYAGAKATAH